MSKCLIVAKKPSSSLWIRVQSYETYEEAREALYAYNSECARTECFHFKLIKEGQEYSSPPYVY